MDRFTSYLREVDPSVSVLLLKVPLQNNPPLAPDWLRCEMLERFRVIREAHLEPGIRLLEVGAGSHAIATVPLAHQVGPGGRVVAVEPARWTFFREIVEAAGVGDRVLPIACDARWLPFRSDSLDLATCVHGIRSLQSEEVIVRVFAEMLRVARKVFLAESLPLARNEAQQAHLAMYNLREEVFEAVTGRRDDLRYFHMDQLKRFVERAGGVIESTRTLDVDLPHALAYLPRSYVEKVADSRTREDLLHRWDEARSLGERYGTDHPPVGVLIATRS
jgi:ubiquinone/menaquinone biosynthesis C-methylase UbiE